MATDLSRLSTADLQAMLRGHGGAAAPSGPTGNGSGETDGTDLSQLSTADLKSMLGEDLAPRFEGAERALASAPQPTADLVAETQERAAGGDPRFNASILDAGATGVGQGITFGTSDEIQAALQTGFGLWGDYGETLDNVRAEMEAARRKYPWLFLGGEIAGGVTNAAGLVKSGLSLSSRAVGRGALRRSAAASGDAAAAGAAFGFGTGEGAEDRLSRADTGAKIGAVLGPLAEGAGNAIGRGVRSAVGRRSAPPVDEFGIPMTQGQRTGNVPQQAFEEAARNEAKGGAAGRIVRDFDTRQRAAIDDAVSDMGATVGGGRPFAEGAGDALQDAGAVTRDAVRNRAEELRRAGSQGFEDAADAEIAFDAVRDLPQRVSAALEGVGEFSPAIAPNATAAVAAIRRFVEKSPASAVAVNVGGIDKLRQVINGLSAQRGTTDATMLGRVRQEFDDWFEGAIDDGLFSGDPQVIEGLRRARRLWADYRRITRPRSGDDAGRIMQKFAEREIGAMEAANYLLGSATAGGTGTSVRLVNRIRETFGADSEPVQALRQAMWMRLTRYPRGNQPPEPAEIRKRIAEFTSGKGADLARALFTQNELRDIRRFGEVLTRLVPKPGATNPSRSAFAASRLMTGLSDNIAAGLGFAAGGFDGGIATRLALPLFRNTMNARRAREAVSGRMPRARVTGGDIASGPQSANIGDASMQVLESGDGREASRQRQQALPAPVGG